MSAPTMTPAEVLRAAADYIDEHGLAKRDWADGRKCCAWGALNYVEAGVADPADHPAWMEWGTSVGELLAEGDVSESVRIARVAIQKEVGVQIALWNDRNGIGKKRVSATLRKVAASLDGAS